MMNSTRQTDITPPSTGCCPRFDPAPWQDRQLVWDNKLFLKEHVHCAWHVPLDMTRTMKRAMERVEAAGAAIQGGLVLGEELSPWRSDLYVEIAKEVPNGETVSFKGTFLSKVFEGPYRDAPKWLKAMDAHLTSAGLRAQKVYLGYTTCPKCAEAYGKNYVIVLAMLA